MRSDGIFFVKVGEKREDLRVRERKYFLEIICIEKKWIDRDIEKMIKILGFRTFERS